MKLDLDFIKQILSVMERYKNDKISLSDLIDILRIGVEDDLKMKRLRKHITALKEMSLIDCESESLGFTESSFGDDYEVIPSLSVLYSLTVTGHQTLEAMSNEALWDKIVSGLESVDIESVNQVPALALALIKEGF